MTNPLNPSHKASFTVLHTMRTPRLLRVVAFLVIMTIFLGIAVLYYTPWLQTTSGTGLVTSLDPRDKEQEIHALVGGRIQEWYVRDGSDIKAGEPIVRIVDNDPLLIERLEAERAAYALKLESTRIGTRTAKLDFDRKQTLFDDGLVARRELENARIRLEDMRVQESQAAAELQRAQVNLSRQSIQEVVAPRDGTILRLAAGDTATSIREGQTLATFIPADVTRAVELSIDGRDIPLVQPGRKVRLQFEGWPAVQFSGWPSIAIGTFGGVVKVVDQSAKPNGRFRVLVIEDPDDQSWPDDHFVRFGAKARGWILLDTVKLGYELWRRMNNFPPNFTADLDIASNREQAE